MFFEQLKMGGGVGLPIFRRKPPKGSSGSNGGDRPKGGGGITKIEKRHISVPEAPC